MIYSELTKARKISFNKALVDRYPFLLPRNRWTDEIVEDYDYSWTELDSLPKGWRDCFGYLICEELKNILEKVNYLNNYRILQIKEKYGSLRWYDGAVPSDIYDNIQKVINKYTDLSEHVCILCGEPAEWWTTDWYSPYCDNCVERYELKAIKPIEEHFAKIETGEDA